MGRKLVIRREPTTSITVFAVDSLLVDDAMLPSEKSKTDTVRRIFLEYFGEEKVKAKQKEIQKKLDRQALLHGERGDQATIDNMYYPRATNKDCVYTHKDLMDIIIECRQLTGELKMRNADDAIRKGVIRGDLEQIDGGYRIINKALLERRIPIK